MNVVFGLLRLVSILGACSQGMAVVLEEYIAHAKLHTQRAPGVFYQPPSAKPSPPSSPSLPRASEPWLSLLSLMTFEKTGCNKSVVSEYGI
jgi:hypothetical protein